MSRCCPPRHRKPATTAAACPRRHRQPGPGLTPSLAGGGGGGSKPSPTRIPHPSGSSWRCPWGPRPSRPPDAGVGSCSGPPRTEPGGLSGDSWGGLDTQQLLPVGQVQAAFLPRGEQEQLRGQGGAQGPNQGHAGTPHGSCSEEQAPPPPPAWHWRETEAQGRA